MNGFTPNNNTNVIRSLSEAIRKCNKSRNRILMGSSRFMYSYTDICLWNGLRKNKCRIYEKIFGWMEQRHPLT